MIHVGENTWNLRILITDLQVEKTLRVKGDQHIGGVMLQTPGAGASQEELLQAAAAQDSRGGREWHWLFAASGGHQLLCPHHRSLQWQQWQSGSLAQWQPTVCPGLAICNHAQEGSHCPSPQALQQQKLLLQKKTALNVSCITSSFRGQF